MPEKKDVDTVLMEKESYDSPFSHELPFERIPQHSSDPRAVTRLINDSLSDADQYIFDFSSFGGSRTDGGRYNELLSPGGSMANIAVGNEKYRRVMTKCLDMVAGLWHLPQEEGNPGGGIPCFSGEQAAFMAGLAAWRRWKNEKTGGVDQPNIVVTVNHNPVWRSFPQLFGVDVRVAIDTAELENLCNDNTILVVGTVGSIQTALDDDIRELSQRLEALSSQQGLPVPLHVDATTTGFVKPFTEPRSKWDFRIPNVTSISASVSYAEFTSVPLGWVLWRNEKDALYAVKGDSSTGEYGGFAWPLPVEETACHFYDMMRFGYDGHRAFQYQRINTACKIRDALVEIPQIYVFGKESRSPFIVFRKNMASSENSWTIESLWKTLAHKGWGTALSKIPSGYGGGNAIRIIVRHDVSERIAGMFISDLRDIISRYES